MSIETDSRIEYYCNHKEYCSVCGKESYKSFMGDQDKNWCGSLKCFYILFEGKIIKRNNCGYCKYHFSYGNIDKCEPMGHHFDLLLGYLIEPFYCYDIRHGREKCNYYKLSIIKWLKSLFNFM